MRIAVTTVLATCVAAAFVVANVVIVVTARRRQWWWHTALWLREQEVPYAHLAMRGDLDKRKDTEVKRDILTTIRRHYNVVRAVDDNPSVIALWQEEGIPTITVPGWCFEPDSGHVGKPS